MPATTKPSLNPSPSLSKSKKPHVLVTAKKSLGAPSQRDQGSRKGKRAWRKNVDIGEVEEGLEELRAEERVTGYVRMVGSNADFFSWNLF
jgi:nucleolar protein 53